VSHPQATGGLVELRPAKLSRVRLTKVFPDYIRLFILGFLHRSSAVQMHESSRAETNEAKNVSL
jgi:hypothetical protein